jgi:predicted DCC family thiol-disulfide oxidoreductase YuxK
MRDRGVERAAPPVRSWILYDGGCGFCRRWVPFWGPTLARRGIGIAPLQADWVRHRLGLSEEEALSDIRLLHETGGAIRGADVYRYVMRRIGWARPLGWLAGLPLLRTIFDAAYRSFARHRHRFSKACGLPSVPRPR